MDNRNIKNPSSRNQPLKPVALPLLVGLLGVSLIGNLALAGFVLRIRKSETAPIPTSPKAEIPVATVKASSDHAIQREVRPYAALGTYVAESNKIPALRWTPQQFEAFQAGMRSSFEGRGIPFDDDAAKLREDINTKVQAMVGATHQDPVEQYFATLREKEGVQRLQSGLHYRVTQEGTGEKATFDTTVVVSYTARLPNGQAIPKLSRARVKSAVADLLKGLAEGVQLLNPGGKALLYLPAELSFKDGTWPEGVPHGAPLVFFLELHEVLLE